MRSVFLDGDRIHSREELHAFLARELELPEWYGGNLDALFDCLTGELEEPAALFLRHTDRFEANLGDYGRRFLRVLADAEEETRMLTLLTVS